MSVINTLLSSLLQVFVFTLIPFIFFLFRKNKSVNFYQYTGFTTPTAKSIYIGVGTSVFFVFTGVVLALVNPGIRDIYLSEKTVTGQLHKLDISIASVTILLCTAIFKTSLSEEILFRGFIARQLIKKSGFKSGNLMQATIFGLVHFFLFR
ncbi:MAG TPA: CPBP family intramembrane metalloprotease, partial [Bacteroidia bacterium]|nr:CPBP family intramembrane metalloprotease [Bacteroidia bacterium]